jgi:hypothetical protein
VSKNISPQQPEELWRNLQYRRQQACSHRRGQRKWAIGLQHNFPDHLPRGICLLCGLVIHPAHWVDWVPGGGPGAMTLVTANMLYPVVQMIEDQDHALAVLRDVYFAAVDSLIASNEARYLSWLDFTYALARGAIHQQCEDNTKGYWR